MTTDKALSDAEGYLLCSACKQRFEPGDVILGQARIKMERYSSAHDWRSDPPIYYFPATTKAMEYLSHFHERCLQ